MSADVVINSLEDLWQFVNDKGVVEIIVRDGKKKYKQFINVAINSTSEKAQKEALQNAMQNLSSLVKNNQKLIGQLANVAKLQNFGLLLNGINLCSTCAGFAIMYAKLDKMSAEIGMQIKALQDTVKKGQDVKADYEFQKVLANHTDMLDCEKCQKPYSEKQMRNLVDDEYNVLTLLINVLQKDISNDRQSLVFSIFSLASMLAVSLRKYDEEYYFNNHAVLGDKNVWHASHDKWVSAFDTLTSDWFVEKLQDLGMFELDLNTSETDAYYLTLVEQARDLKDSIKDNQDLIVALGDIDALKAVRHFSNQQVADSIAKAFQKAGIQLDSDTAAIGYEAMKQVGLA